MLMAHTSKHRRDNLKSTKCHYFSFVFSLSSKLLHRINRKRLAVLVADD